MAGAGLLLQAGPRPCSGTRVPPRPRCCPAAWRGPELRGASESQGKEPGKAQPAPRGPAGSCLESRLGAPVCREVNAQGPAAPMEFLPPAGGSGNAASGVCCRNRPRSAAGWAHAGQGPKAPWPRRACGWCVVSCGSEGALRARAACPELPYLKPMVAGDSSIQNTPWSSLRPALSHIFPSLPTRTPWPLSRTS